MNLEKVEILRTAFGQENNLVCHIEFEGGKLYSFGIYIYHDKDSEENLHLYNINNLPQYKKIKKDLQKATNMKEVIEVLKKHKRKKELKWLIYSLIQGRGVKETP